MKKFEHFMAHFNVNDCSFINADELPEGVENLKDAGSKGWELVGVTNGIVEEDPRDDSQFKFLFFKREITE